MTEEELKEEFVKLQKRLRTTYGMVKWIVDDFRLYAKRSMPRWKNEFVYFRAMIEQAKTPIDVHNMDMREWAAFRESLPFIKKANPSFLKDPHGDRSEYKHSPLRDLERVTIYTTDKFEEE